MLGLARMIFWSFGVNGWLFLSAGISVRLIWVKGLRSFQKYAPQVNFILVDDLI